MVKKIKKYCWVLLGLALIPWASFAATEWGVGIDTDGGITFGIGSRGSGAGNVWGTGTSNYSWSLSNPYGLPQGTIMGIVSNLLFWLLALFGILGVLGLLLSGVFYLISAGDKDMIERGKTTMKWSIIGIIVGLSGFIILQAMFALLSAQKSF